MHLFSTRVTRKRHNHRDGIGIYNNILRWSEKMSCKLQLAIVSTFRNRCITEERKNRKYNFFWYTSHVFTSIFEHQTSHFLKDSSRMQCFKLSSKYKSMWYIRETTHIYLSRRFNSLHQTEKDQNPGKKQADDIFQTDFVDMVQCIGLVFTEYKTSETKQCWFKR